MFFRPSKLLPNVTFANDVIFSLFLFKKKNISGKKTIIHFWKMKCLSSLILIISDKKKTQKNVRG